MKKIISYNLNGIRSAMSKNLTEWLEKENPDVICFQELKAQPDQIEAHHFEALGYKPFWFSAQKKGYSGVAILSKETPKHVEYGCGHPDYDFEGRVIRADFKSFSIISVYMPSGTTGEIRQDVKYQFLDFFYDYTQKLLLTHPNLIISGDYNIAHTPTDIHDPKGNANSSGFLPEERAWLTKYMEIGLTDTFRNANPDMRKYSWWSFRANSRTNNKGWRIDYHLVSKGLQDKIVGADCINDAHHSDHCPISLALDI